MKTRLAIAVAAMLLVPALLWAGDGISVAVNQDGRKVFVNDATSPNSDPPVIRPAANAKQFVYWSNREHRWKPAPRAKLAAARTAAAEVDQYVAASDAQMTAVTSASVEAAIQEAAHRHNVDPALVRALIQVESGFNPRAVSRKGAMGLMQLMPGTARDLNVANPFDPKQNVEGGVRHLRSLLDAYGGDLNKSLAAYNAGAKAVDRANGVPPYREPRHYVRTITSLYSSGAAGRPSNGASAEPIRVYRDHQGVLNFSNVE